MPGAACCALGQPRWCRGRRLPLPCDNSKVILTEHLIFDQRNRTGGGKSDTRMWPKLRVYPGGRIFGTSRGGGAWLSQPSLTGALSVSVLRRGSVSCSSDARFPGRRSSQSQVLRSPGADLPGGRIWVHRYGLRGSAVLRNAGRRSPDACCTPSPAALAERRRAVCHFPWPRSTLPRIQQRPRPSGCPWRVLEAWRLALADCVDGGAL